MKSLHFTLVSGVLLAGLVLVSTPRSADAAPICPHIHKPVCALNPAGVRSTYPNACFARAAHARILHPGECFGGPFCFFIYSPVCAINPATHKRQTYSNLCVAEHANATWLRNGACP
jgi:hypothetical protein